MSFKKFYVNAADMTKPDQLQRTFSTVQQNVADAFTELDKISVLNNVIVADVTVTTSGTVVQHKLGRKPLGYIITQKAANADIWNGDINDKTLTLVSTATVIVSILVY